MDTALHAVKTASIKVVHKASEFSGNKIAGALSKWSDNKVVEQELFEEMLFH